MAYGTVQADVIQSSVANTSLGAGNASIMKNRIINGAMVIDQRNAGASVTIPATAVTYTLDRWFAYSAQASKFSVQQNAGSVTPPVGFTNYLGVTSLSAYSVGANEQFILRQPIEGYNTADLGWGTANAKTITISFQVYSSLTGNFGGVLRNAADNRSYPFLYAVSSANTWTSVSITVAGDTTGTWVTNNGAGLKVQFGLGCGSSVSGTAGSWSANTYESATGATSVVGTNGATFYITGVQLEVGSSATGFEYRQYQQELALCQRYAQPIGQGSTGRVYSATQIETAVMFKVPMRAFPSITFGGNAGASTSISQFGVGSTTATAATTSGVGTATGCYVLYTVSGATTGSVAGVYYGDTCLAFAEL